MSLMSLLLFSLLAQWVPGLEFNSVNTVRSAIIAKQPGWSYHRALFVMVGYYRRFQLMNQVGTWMRTWIRTRSHEEESTYVHSTFLSEYHPCCHPLPGWANQGLTETRIRSLVTRWWTGLLLQNAEKQICILGEMLLYILLFVPRDTKYKCLSC